MACPRIARCPLFNALSMKSSLGVWTSLYCEGTYARCERFKLASAGQTVPQNLLPNGRLLDGPLSAL